MIAVKASRDRGWKTVPNAISALRGLMAIVVVVLIVNSRYGWAMGLFLFAAATDWVDGFIAKRFNQMSTFGKVFDTVVDKLLIFGTVATMSWALNSSAVWLAFAIVMIRELFVFVAKRSIVTSTGRIDSAAEAGRFSMVAQSVSTTMLFLWAMSPEQWQTIATAALWFGVGASLASGWAYVADALKARKGASSK